jgi:hypothetical protein
MSGSMESRHARIEARQEVAEARGHQPRLTKRLQTLQVVPSRLAPGPLTIHADPKP